MKVKLKVKRNMEMKARQQLSMLGHKLTDDKRTSLSSISWCDIIFVTLIFFGHGQIFRVESCMQFSYFVK